MNNKKGAVVIPARFKSTRLPGKPLVKINGKTMINHVYERCVDAVGHENVYVATDDLKIQYEVNSFQGNVLMTSDTCLTGTDRLAEANEILDFDFLINVQGDEPLINPLSIRKVFNKMREDNSRVINCYCDILDDEIDMPSVPKVVISESSRLLYMSRGGPPFNKSGESNAKYKQVCIYGFNREHLKIFKNYAKKTSNEDIEDIEILRFLDLDFHVDMVKVDPGSIAVDTNYDLERVRLLMLGPN